MNGGSAWPDEHRLALSVVAAASAVLLAFGFLSVGKSIRQPFEAKNGNYRTPEEQQAEAIAALKFRDTDADGVTDYDEMEIYHSSAYLSDTDSDGVSDGKEIQAGDDPNCPKGKTCESSAYYAAPVSKANPENLVDKSQFVDVGFGAAGIDPALLSKFDPKQVRSLLKSAGMSEEQLSKFTDAQLEQVYKEALSDQVPTSTLDKLDKQQENEQKYAASSTP